MRTALDLYPELKEKHPWSYSGQTIWLASTLKLHRNLSKFLFSTKLDNSSQRQVQKVLLHALNEGRDYCFPLHVTASELDPSAKHLLFEQFLSEESFQQLHHYEGFAIDTTGHFFALFNVRDHLQLQYNDAKGEIENAWEKLSRLENHLSRSLHFAFSARFGYLTADSHHCGTGLKVQIFLHLPALIQSELLKDILEKHRDERVLTCSLQGEQTGHVGDLLKVCSHYTLGVSEEEILSSLRALTTKLIAEEKHQRLQLRQEQSVIFKNKVSRAFGLLMHSYELETAECLDAISLCKLGVDVGWITGIGQKELNHLYFNCQRAHLMGQLQEEILRDEIPIKRAEWMHLSLKKACLHV